MSETNVNKYRRKHKRCRTCKYSYTYNNSNGVNWECRAKNFRINFYDIKQSTCEGMFCKLYEPKEFEE